MSVTSAHAIGFFGQAASPEHDIVSSNMDEHELKTKSSMAPNKMPSTSEVLFLKRLLYLKASIDNESTLNTMSVPFEQEKRRDHAPVDQLMLDTQGVMSGKSSMGTIKAGNMLDYNSTSHYDNASMTMAVQPYPQTA